MQFVFERFLAFLNDPRMNASGRGVEAHQHALVIKPVVRSLFQVKPAASSLLDLGSKNILK
jgi:hypothetical protein